MSTTTYNDKGKDAAQENNSDSNAEWMKFIGDLQHSIKLAAKEAGKNEEESKKLEWQFFDFRGTEQDRVKLFELAEQFCKENNLAQPNFPIICTKTKVLKKGKKKDDEEVEEMSFVETDDALYEQFYVKANRATGYMRYGKQTGKITDVDDVTFNGIKFRPRMGDEFNAGAILLPENTEDYESTEKLLCDIQQFIEKYVDIPVQYRIYCSYYILLSWVYDRFNTINYLRVRGDLGQGKTRFLQTVGQLCYKPMIVSGALGAAPVFRMISRWNGTLVMDESDFNRSDETDQLIKVLNVGYQKGMCVMRCDKNDPNKLDFFKVFGPKVISSRKAFDDQALESRCLSHEMYRTRRKNIPDTLISTFEAEQMKLRNKLLLYRFQNYLKVDSDKINEIQLGDEIEPRLRQATRAFVALFMDNEKMLADFKVFLKAYNRKLVAERSVTIDGLIVRGIALLVQYGKTDISAKDIMEVLSETGDLWDKASSRSIGKRLSAIGIQTEDKRVVTKDLKNAVRNCIVWSSFDLTIFDRYLSNLEIATVAKEIGEKLVACSVCSDSIEDRHQTQQCGKMATEPKCSVIPPGPNISRYKRYILQAENGQKLPIPNLIQKVIQLALLDAKGGFVSLQDIFDGIQGELGETVKDEVIQSRLDALLQVGYIYSPMHGKLKLVDDTIVIEEKVTA